MAKKSPMALTLAILKERDLVYEKTEHWNAFAKCRNDFLGFIDIVVLMGKYHVGIQVTTQANRSARIKKITTDKKIRPKVTKWLERGDRIEVWGWHKIMRRRTDGKRGKVGVWQANIAMITLADMMHE